jgi:hypothetical protein
MLQRLCVTFGLVFASASFAAAAWFVERPGIQEFSGEMTVRPLQPDALAAWSSSTLPMSTSTRSWFPFIRPRTASTPT